MWAPFQPRTRAAPAGRQRGSLDATTRRESLAGGRRRAASARGERARATPAIRACAAAAVWASATSMGRLGAGGRETGGGRRTIDGRSLAGTPELARPRRARGLTPPGVALALVHRVRQRVCEALSSPSTPSPHTRARAQPHTVPRKLRPSNAPTAQAPTRRGVSAAHPQAPTQLRLLAHRVSIAATTARSSASLWAAIATPRACSSASPRRHSVEPSTSASAEA